ncbi:MAG TPA: TetR family transcriptional regulator [Jatrophihabitans sp.]
MADADAISKADVTRARLIDAALIAFAAKGFHATTTRDIAAGAGLSSAALYVHHKSKEELLYLIAHNGHEQTLQLIRSAAAKSTSPVEQLQRIVYDFVLYHAREHTTARVVNYELGALTPEHYKEIARLRHRIDRTIRTVLDRGVFDGDFVAVEPRVVTVAVLSLGIDVARWYREGGTWTPEVLAQRYADMALRLAGAQPATRR